MRRTSIRPSCRRTTGAARRAAGSVSPYSWRETPDGSRRRGKMLDGFGGHRAGPPGVLEATPTSDPRPPRGSRSDSDLGSPNPRGFQKRPGPRIAEPPGVPEATPTSDRRTPGVTPQCPSPGAGSCWPDVRRRAERVGRGCRRSSPRLLRPPAWSPPPRSGRAGTCAAT